MVAVDPRLTQARLDTASEVLADYADLESPYLGHSAWVADLAVAAGRVAGLATRRRGAAASRPRARPRPHWGAPAVTRHSGDIVEEARTMPKVRDRADRARCCPDDPAQLHGLPAQSNAELRGLGSDIRWAHSYVAEDRLFCVYNAEGADLIHEHARLRGFSCDNVRQVTALIDPVTGEG